MRTLLVVAALLVGCGGPAAELLDGHWDVDVLDASGAVRCSGTMILKTANHVDLSGTAELCGASQSSWHATVTGRILTVGQAELSFDMQDQSMSIGKLVYDPSWLSGYTEGLEGVGAIRALRHGARVGKVMGPPLDVGMGVPPRSQDPQ
jgi:hypothetical protein